MTNFLVAYIHLEPVCPLFWASAPPKQGLFQSKQGSFGFQALWKTCNLQWFENPPPFFLNLEMYNMFYWKRWISILCWFIRGYKDRSLCLLCTARCWNHRNESFSPLNQLCLWWRQKAETPFYRKRYIIMGILATPPKLPPPKNKALLRV